MKTCQFCAEEVQDAAKVCKHCGRDLDGKPAAPVVPATVIVEERSGLMGRQGTAWGAANFGCAAVLAGIAGIVAIVLGFAICNGRM